MTYTQQEMIIKDATSKAGASFAMYKDYVLVYGKNFAYGKHVEDRKVLGILTNYGRSGQFEMDYDIIYEHCRPVTKEEVEQYLVKEN